MRLTTLLLMLAIPQLLGAQGKPAAIDELVHLFAGANHTPVCRVTPNTSGDVQRTRECAWAMKATARPEPMTIAHNAGEGALLTWDHVVAPGEASRAFLDSISRFAEARKLVARDCGRSNETPAGPAHGMLWSSAEFVLHVTHFTPSASPHRVLVLATDAPKEFPEALVCPGTKE